MLLGIGLNRDFNSKSVGWAVFSGSIHKRVGSTRVPGQVSPTAPFVVASMGGRGDILQCRHLSDCICHRVVAGVLVALEY